MVRANKRMRRSNASTTCPQEVALDLQQWGKISVPSQRWPREERTNTADLISEHSDICPAARINVCPFVLFHADTEEALPSLSTKKIADFYLRLGAISLSPSAVMARGARCKRKDASSPLDARCGGIKIEGFPSYMHGL